MQRCVIGHLAGNYSCEGLCLGHAALQYLRSSLGLTFNALRCSGDVTAFLFDLGT